MEGLEAAAARYLAAQAESAESTEAVSILSSAILKGETTVVKVVRAQRPKAITARSIGRRLCLLPGRPSLPQVISLQDHLTSDDAQTRHRGTLLLAEVRSSSTGGRLRAPPRASARTAAAVVLAPQSTSSWPAAGDGRGSTGA
jgi:hypothetical protein